MSLPAILRLPAQTDQQLTSRFEGRYKGEDPKGTED
ncbi:hypothetical protein FHS28_003649 [Roseateles terrae]|uniref:Uncharacterized protein n=1 Tax=Roseateles terrae TaxID=431060 RepID=A0ABR6GVV2_9BURK|nr:hypothetical protein [Roseateles terrae]